MSTMERWQKNGDPRQTQPSARPPRELSPRAEFLELKKDFPAEVLQDIKNFRTQFPQLREHAIYRVMKKHDMKRNLVEPELRFYAEMQGSEPVDQRERKPKRPNPPKDQRPRPAEQRKEGEEPKRDGQQVQRQGSRKDGETAEVMAAGQEDQGAKDRPQNRNEEDRRGMDRTPREWKAKPRRDRGWDRERDGPGPAQQNRQDGNQSPTKVGGQQRHYKDQAQFPRRSSNPKAGNQDRPNAPREYNDRPNPKRGKGNFQGGREAEEYVAKHVEEQRPKPSKPVAEPEQAQGLSKINEESEDQSHHRLQVEDSADKHHQHPAHKAPSSTLHHSKQPATTDSKGSKDRPGWAGDLADLQASPAPRHHHDSHRQTTSSPSSQHHLEHGLVSNGLSVLSKFFHKAREHSFRQFLTATRHLAPRPKSEVRNGPDKRSGFFDSKKRKPAIKNNFETEENDESTTERAKKLNYVPAKTQRFESEEERMKGDRERALESKVNDSIGQFNFLAQKIKDLEAEVRGLKAANAELSEKNRASAAAGEDNIFCFVPYHFVKDWYPFNSIRAGDLKAGNVYMVKRDE